MPTTETEPGVEPHSYPKQNWLLYLNLSMFWFALSFLWAGMITVVIQRLVENMVGPDLKPLYLGWTLAIGAFISTVVVIVTGTLSDRSRWAMGRRRPYIIVGTILSVPVLLWMAFVRSIPVLILDFCLIQLWVNVATSPYQALIPDMVPKGQQGTASAYMGMTSLVGQLGGLILCGKLMDRPGGLVIVMAVLSSIMLVLMLYTVITVRERPASANPLPKIGLIGTFVESFRVSPRQYPDFFRLIASRFVINMGFYTATEFLYYYVKDTLHSPTPLPTVVTIFCIATVSGLAGNFPAGILSDRVSKKLVVYISALITGSAALIFVLTSSIPIALATAFIYGAGFGAFMAVDWAFATNLLPEKDEAKYMGIWHVSFTVPQVIAPFVGGMVAYYFNRRIGPGFGYRVALFFVIIYLAIGTAMIRPIKERVIPKG